MRAGVRVGLALALVLGFAVSSTQAKVELFSYETEFLKLIYYTKDHEYIVPHLARSFENSLRFHRDLFDYTPSGKVVILLHDFGDYGHGGTSTVPWNYVTIGIEPFDHVYDTMPANERMNWLMHHELVHVVATDKGAGADNTFRKLMVGKVAPTADQPLSMFYSYFTSPRWYAPRWFHEGIAVFLETWMAGGLGRVLGGYDEMVFRTMVLEDSYFYDVVGLESEGTAIDFQVGQNSYLYGTRFVTYLGLQHGPDKLIRWFDRREGSKRYFSKQFKEVYGVPLHEEWSRWIEWEGAWQQENLTRIREYRTTEDRPVAAALGSASRPHYDAANNRILAAVNYPGKSAHIAAIYLEDGRIEKIAGVSQPALYYVSSVAYDSEADKLFYTTDNTRGWRDLNEVDLQSGRRRRLLKDVRAGDLVVDPIDHAIWAVQHHNGLSSIIRIPPPYSDWETLVTLDYGRDVFDIDVSPDGKHLSAALIEINGQQRLVMMETEKLRAGDGSIDVLYEFADNSPANFIFGPDGRSLYGTSYYSGVSNIFRYDLETREVEALTNAESGYFRPLVIDSETLFAFRYSGQGLLPVTLPIEVHEDVNAIRYLGQQVVREHPEVKDWNAGSPLQVDLEQVTLRSGRYDPAKSMRLGSLYPVVEGYRGTYAFGARFNISDPVAIHSVDITAAFSQDDNVGQDNEQTHIKIEYNHWPWRIRAGHNASDFYDLFGPTEQSRKGSYLSFGYEGLVLNRRPQTLSYDVSVSGFTGLDTLPQYQNVAATIDKYATLVGRLDYEHFRRTIGAVTVEKGLGWEFASINNYGDDDLFSKLYTDLDYGFLTGIDHSSIWLRGSAGWSFGDEDETFSNFYFGGFGNNWVDHQESRRYREYYAFPGTELNEIEANNYGKLTVEWVLPAVRFRSAGTPGFYANWMQFALFTSGLVANVSGELPRREIGNVGLQVDFKLVLFSNLESTLSLGYASSFEDGLAPHDEFMASLKLLR